MRLIIFIKYHWLLYFFQWLKMYSKHLINAFRVDAGVGFRFRLYLYKWNNWSRYSAIHHYRLRLNKHVVQLIPFREFNNQIKDICNR